MASRRQQEEENPREYLPLGHSQNLPEAHHRPSNDPWAPAADQLTIVFKVSEYGCVICFLQTVTLALGSADMRLRGACGLPAGVAQSLESVPVSRAEHRASGGGFWSSRLTPMDSPLVPTHLAAVPMSTQLEHTCSGS